VSLPDVEQHHGQVFILHFSLDSVKNEDLPLLFSLSRQLSIMLENCPMERFQKLKNTPPSSADFEKPGTGIILYIRQG